MIKDVKTWRKFKDEYIKKEKLTLDEKFKIYDEMWLWAKELGIFPLKDPLDEIEKDTKLAKLFKKLQEKYEQQK